MFNFFPHNFKIRSHYHLLLVANLTRCILQISLYMVQLEHLLFKVAIWLHSSPQISTYPFIQTNRATNSTGHTTVQ